jgi:hypothetical protein
MHLVEMILDLYPDCVNEYGLIGCGLVTALVITWIAFFVSLIRNYLT